MLVSGDTIRVHMMLLVVKCDSSQARGSNQTIWSFFYLKMKCNWPTRHKCYTQEPQNVRLDFVVQYLKAINL